MNINEYCCLQGNQQFNAQVHFFPAQLETGLPKQRVINSYEMNLELRRAGGKTQWER